MTEQVKERPILFSAPMVRAILDGSKTQTRRIAKPQPHPAPKFAGDYAIYQRPGTFTRGQSAGELAVECPYVYEACPYGPPGDRLWVRETWYCDDYRVQQGPYLKPDDLDTNEARSTGLLVYGADGLTPYEAEQPVWKPSIHMPRWASRITLEITGVRVERLHDISEADAIAEGAPWRACGAPQDGSHKAGFAELWESINGAGSWDANPFVWVVEFKRLDDGVTR